jgi:hypothetical protein
MIDNINITDDLELNKDTSLEQTQESQESQESEKSRSQHPVEALIEELFHTSDKEPYALIRREKSKVALPVDSAEFESFVDRASYFTTGKLLKKFDKEDLLNHLRAKALFDGEEHSVFYRIGKRTDGSIEIDLANEAGEVAHISKSGWEITQPTLRFRKTRVMLPLPTPIKGGSIDLLWKSLNITSKKDRAMLAGWIVGAFHPDGPYPILIIQASKGSGKSTAMGFIRSLIDPALADKRALFKTEEDLYIAAENNWVLSYDNLVGLKGEISDMLCRIATGGAFASRKLYTNKTESVMEACRPIILNGIEDIASRSDLISRSIQITLNPISGDLRRSMGELEAEFQKNQPAIFGVILDCVVEGLKHQDTIRLTEQPRMADFAQFVTPAEDRLGLPKGFIVQSMIDNQKQQDIDAVMMDEIANKLIDFVSKQRSMFWTGTMTQLHSAITPERVTRSWPMSARVLSQRINHLEPQLKEIGVDIDRRGGERKTISIQIVDQSCVSSVSCDFEYDKLEPIDLDNLPV